MNIVTDTKILEVSKAGGQLVLMSDNFSMKVDKVILATGFTMDLFATLQSPVLLKFNCGEIRCHRDLGYC